MRCYLVLVHGVFVYHVKPLPTGLDLTGFYAGRTVFARNEDHATQRAFATVKIGLAKWNIDVRDGLVSTRLDADEVSLVPFWYLFRRSNRAHTFYGD
jgi:hypothetical protein